jgi:Raf kinase inhibitor-like YbhB/YbcL family protein
MNLTSDAFGNGEPIPARYTCDGANVAPDLAWNELPAGTASLALCCFDPDAPSGTFVHWTIWELDPSLGGLPEGHVPPEAHQGRNGFGELGYGGPCPPPGHGVHHYHFQLSALRQPLDLSEAADPAAFTAAFGDLELDRAELIGLYQRR